MFAELFKIVFAVTEKGAGQTGGKAHVTFATHPAALVVVPDLNLNVKHPSGLEDVNVPGLVVHPQEPSKAPGTVPAGLPLKN